MGQRAAKRYAKALIEYGIEKKALDKFLKDANDISSTINKSSDLRAILNSPIIKGTDKLSILKAVFKSSDETFHKLFESLFSHNRFDHLNKICESFAHQYNEVNNIQEAHIKSAIKLDDKTLKVFQKKIKDITGDTAKITASVDTDLLGGFILNINNLQYDASVSGKLKKLKQNLYKR